MSNKFHQKIEEKIQDMGLLLGELFSIGRTGISMIVNEWWDEDGGQEVLQARMTAFLEEYVLPQDEMQAGQGWFYTCCPAGLFYRVNELRQEKGLKPLDENKIWEGTLTGSNLGDVWELHRHWNPYRIPEVRENQRRIEEHDAHMLASIVTGEWQAYEHGKG